MQKSTKVESSFVLFAVKVTIVTVHYQSMCLNPRTKKAIKSPKKSCLHDFTTMELFLLANAAVERK